MSRDWKVRVQGLPDSAPPGEVALCRSRLMTALQEFIASSGERDLRVVLESGAAPGRLPASAPPASKRGDDDVFDEETLAARARQYRSRPPNHRFDFLVVSSATIEALLDAVATIELRHRIFDEWNLRAVQPYTGIALNFFGPPGTGKTLAAECLADRLGKPFMPATYAQIESKFHGDGPKNVDALFHAAERDDALLFIDEADSLLSKRLTNVRQGSEQAINSMRSQLLLNLETFHGIAVFATNLVENYDAAFETRIQYVEFTLPDLPARRKIWWRHLPPELPLAPDVNVDELAAVEGISGRDIRNAVLRAAIRAARQGRPHVSGEDFAAFLPARKTTTLSAAIESPAS